MPVAVVLALMLVLGLALSGPVHAQTKEDTIVYSLQSDVDSWDPPASVLREAIILGYHAFDHLATRDLKTRRVGPNLATSWRNIDDTTWEVKLRQGVKFHDGTPLHRQGRQGHLRPRARSRQEDDRARQPRQDQERGGDGRLHGALQDRRPLSALRGAPHRAGDAVREGDAREGRRVDGREPGRHRALQAGEVEPEAGPSPRPQRRLLGSQALLQVPPHPDHPREGHRDRRAALRRRGHHQGGAAGPDGRHRQVGRGAHRRPRPSSAPPCSSSTRPRAAARTRSQDRKVRQAANLAVDIDGIIKHVLNGLGDRVATGINPMAFGWDPNLKPYKQDLAAAKKLLAEAGYPERRGHRLPRGPAHRRARRPADQRRHRGRHGQGRLPREARLHRREHRARWPASRKARSGPCSTGRGATTRSSTPTPSSTTSSSAASRTATTATRSWTTSSSTGRSTLDAKKRAEIYVKAQKLLYDDAAYLYKWGLRGVWGISNRVEYTAPADEVDRMFLVTPAEEVGPSPDPVRPPASACAGGGRPDRRLSARTAMRRYLARQLVQLVVVIIGISILVLRASSTSSAIPCCSSCPRTPARRSSSATASCSGWTGRSTCSTGSSPAGPSGATSASPGTATRPPSPSSSSACRPPST